MGSFSATLSLRRVRRCSMLLRQCRYDALAFFFDVLGETRVALLHETGSQAELEERYRECRRQIVEIGTDLGELECFYGFVEKLLHRVVKLIVEQFGLGHRSVFLRGNNILSQLFTVRLRDAPLAHRGRPA